MQESEISSTSGTYSAEYQGSDIDTVNAKSVNLTQCYVQSVNADNVSMEQSAGIFVAAEKVESKNSAALLMVAQEIHGDVRPIFSLPAALVIAGAIIFGVTLYNRK